MCRHVRSRYHRIVSMAGALVHMSAEQRKRADQRFQRQQSLTMTRSMAQTMTQTMAQTISHRDYGADDIASMTMTPTRAMTQTISQTMTRTVTQSSTRTTLKAKSTADRGLPGPQRRLHS